MKQQTAGEKLRKDGLVAYNLTVFLQTNRFKDVPQYHNSYSVQMPSGTAATNKHGEMLRQMKSPAYSTNWDELITVK